jgi:DnaJ family protein B protein 4
MSDYRQHGGAGPYLDPYQHLPPPHTLPGETKSFHFASGGRPGPFNFSNPEDIFSEFLKNKEGIYPGMGPDPKADAPRKEITIVEKPLPLSLEELFRGVNKKLKISRKTYDISTGRQSTQDRVLEVPVRKGLKPGSKIKFADIGDQTAEGTQDMHFIITEVGELSSKLQVHH